MKDTCGRVPVVGRPARQPPGQVGSAGAPRLFYSPEAEVQWGEVSAMGRSETAEKLLLEEDSRTSIEGGLSRAGISPRATMRQGVDQPCGIRGSWGCGPALLFPSTAAPPTSPPPPLWHRVSTPAACGGGGREWGPKRRLAGRERAAGGQQGRQERRGLDEGRDGPLPHPSCEKGIQSPLSTPGGPEESERGCAG